jgi:hypothetical protein
VVVEVTVDQNGKTISATAGIKGTTNTASCLLDQARIAAMNTNGNLTVMLLLSKLEKLFIILV